MTAHPSVLLLLALALLLLPLPAAAVQIDELALNCAGTFLGPGAVVDNVGCQGQGLYFIARLSGWPVPEAPVIQFRLLVDGVEAGGELRTLPGGDLGPVFGSTDNQHYTGLGVGWRLPLDALCQEGCVARAVASLELIGGEAQEVAFALNVPTPEPTTLLLLATTGAGLGLLRRYHRRGSAHAA